VLSAVRTLVRTRPRVDGWAGVDASPVANTTNNTRLYDSNSSTTPSSVAPTDALQGAEMARAVKAASRRPLFRSPSRSLAVARQATSTFHQLTHELARAREAGEATEALEAALNEAGGRAAYQAASVLTTGRHRTASFVFSVLTRLNLRPSSREPPLPLLEVGAVNLQLSAIPWLATRAIDLRSTNPRIEQRDFFTLPPRAAYRVVVCAMVLNCVPSAPLRGRMLLGMRAHLRLGGLVFIMLPLRCLTHSPYMDEAHFEAALAVAGFAVVERKLSPKVFFWCARAVAELAPLRSYIPLRGRPGRGKTNDFAVSFDD